MDDILLLLFAERMLNCQIIKQNNEIYERGNRMVVSIGKERKV